MCQNPLCIFYWNVVCGMDSQIYLIVLKLCTTKCLRTSDSSLQIYIFTSARTWQWKGCISPSVQAFLSCQETGFLSRCLLTLHTSCHLLTEPNRNYIMRGTPTGASPQVILLILVSLSTCTEKQIWAIYTTTLILFKCGKHCEDLLNRASAGEQAEGLKVIQTGHIGQCVRLTSMKPFLCSSVSWCDMITPKAS